MRRGAVAEEHAGEMVDALAVWRPNMRILMHYANGSVGLKLEYPEMCPNENCYP